jgi:hypothetical protein
MSILSTIEIEVEPIVAEAKEWAGKAVDFLKDVPIMLEQKAIALIKETSLGTAILNLISAAEGTGAAGADKFGAVVAAAEAAYEAFVSNGGLKGLIATGVSILRALVEVFVANFKSVFGGTAATA